jgi:hypothetical protein
VKFPTKRPNTTGQSNHETQSSKAAVRSKDVKRKNRAYVEDWANTCEVYSVCDNIGTSITDRSEWGSSIKAPYDPDIHKHLTTQSSTTSKHDISPKPVSNISPGFHAVSIILSTENNLLLNSDNTYDIRFNTGMVEGNGISINETGNIITFTEDGSYRFEISGEATLFSDVDVKLIYFNENFTEEIKSFNETAIPKDEGKLQLRGIPTILPIQKNQSIIARLLPTPDETIILFAGARLLIHRVA